MPPDPRAWVTKCEPWEDESHTKISQDFVSLDRQKPEVHEWKWIIRMLEETMLDKIEITDAEALSQDSDYNVPAWVALRIFLVT